MGGSQSQESSVATASAVSSSSSSTSGLMRDSVVQNEASEVRTSESSSAQDLNITPLFLSASSRSLSPPPPPSLIRTEREVIREEGGEEPQDMSEDNNASSALMTFHSFLSRSLRASAEGSDFADETGNQQAEGIEHSSNSAHQDDDDRRQRSRGNGHHHHHHHHRDHSSSSSSSSQHGHHHRHHHHRHHHHRQDGSSHERRSHRSERSRRRYAATDDHMLDSDPFNLGISWTTLQQRLQALQGDDDGGGGARNRHGADSSGSGRNSSRSHRSRMNGQLFFFRPPDRMISCPYCKKDFLSSEIDNHKSLCKIKPRVQFNEDKLLQDSGECSICLDDMLKGDSIARLPCLCIYHLRCLKKWYEKSQTCPAHPELT